MTAILADVNDHDLRTLAIGHYVVAGTTALFACMALIYIAMGFFFVAFGPSMTSSNDQAPPAFVGWIFVAIGAVFFVLGLGYSACVYFAGRNIAQRRRYTFCQVIAGVNCLNMPLGTVLGIFTFVVMMRPGIRERFDAAPPPPPLPAAPA